MADLLDRELLFITGKGGVGKTTVALAAGLAAAAGGRRTVIAEAGGQNRIASAFGRSDIRYGAEAQLEDNLWTVSVDPVLALEQFVAQHLRSRALTQALTRSNAFRAFVEAAPGARELITMGALWDLVQPRRWSGKAQRFDVVIVDAPASGHGIAMLQTPHTFAEIARVGPLATQASNIRTWVSDPVRAGYAVVTLPQEMPVAETIELEQRLNDTVGLRPEAIVVNGVLPRRFSAAERDAAVAETKRSKAVGTSTVVTNHAGRSRDQQSQIARLRRTTTASVSTLPLLTAPTIELEQLRELTPRVAKALA